MEFPFVVSRTVSDRLGDSLLRDIARNLWLADCQECGRPFVDERPSLVVDDLGESAAATLYHRACRSSEYCTERWLMKSDEAFLSYNVVTSLLAVELDDGTPGELPLVMINPSLEQVILRRGDDGTLHVATVEHFQDVGMRGIDPRRPVPGAHAAFVDRVDLLRVWIGLTGQHWDCPIEVSTGVIRRIREQRGVAVALTTAYFPYRLIGGLVEDFARALESGDVATGWVELVR